MNDFDVIAISLSAVSRLGSNPSQVMLFLFTVLVLLLAWMVATAWKSRFPPTPAVPVEVRVRRGGRPKQ